MFIHFHSDVSRCHPQPMGITRGRVEYTEGPKERVITFSVDDEGADLLKRIVSLIGYAHHLGLTDAFGPTIGKDQAPPTDQESEPRE